MYLLSLPKLGTNLLTPPFLCHIHLQYCYKNLTMFSGANGQSLCNSCDSSGCLRSTSDKYPSELFSSTKLH